MKKLALKLEELEVESFAVDNSLKGGVESLSEPTQFDCSDLATQCAGCSGQICSDACAAPTVEWYMC